MNQMSGKAAPRFTAKQGQYLAFIDAYTRVNRQPPAERDIQRFFGVTPPTVHQMILTPRAQRLHPQNARRFTQHRDTRSARTTPRRASLRSSRQNLCAEVLG
jgi:Mn-dependent DtxR family transcriptional regulator